MRQIIISQGIAMFAVLTSVIWPASNTPSVTATQTSQLTGIVTDTNAARVANATVTITGRGMARAVITSEDGTYSVDLPPSIYRIAIESKGFCLAHRAAFRMDASKPLRLDLTLVVCPIVNAVKIENGKYKGETDAYQSPFKEEELKVRSSTPGLKLFVQFGRRIRARNIISYEGFAIEGAKVRGVTASYNQLTVYAERLRFDKMKLLLVAEGNVLLDNGQQRVQAKHAEIILKASEPVTKVVSR